MTAPRCATIRPGPTIPTSPAPGRTPRSGATATSRRKWKKNKIRCAGRTRARRHPGVAADGIARIKWRTVPDITGRYRLTPQELGTKSFFGLFGKSDPEVKQVYRRAGAHRADETAGRLSGAVAGPALRPRQRSCEAKSDQLSGDARHRRRRSMIAITCEYAFVRSARQPSKSRHIRRQGFEAPHVLRQNPYRYSHCRHHGCGTGRKYCRRGGDKRRRNFASSRCRMGLSWWSFPTTARRSSRI